MAAVNFVLMRPFLPFSGTSNGHSVSGLVRVIGIVEFAEDVK